MMMQHKNEEDGSTNLTTEPTIREYGGTMAEPVLALQEHSHLFWKTVTHHSVAVFMGIVTGFCAWTVTSLLLYHARIISIGETTNERYRHVYARERNPFDRGCCQNWALCLQRSVGRQLPVSRLPRDFSVVVREPPDVVETVWSSGDATTTTAATPTNNKNTTASRKIPSSGSATSLGSPTAA